MPAQIFGLDDVNAAGKPGVAVFRFARAVTPAQMAPLMRILPDSLPAPTASAEVLGFPWRPCARSLDAQRSILEGLDGLTKARFYAFTEDPPARSTLPFGVDGGEFAVEDYDWDDFGAAVKFSERPAGLRALLLAYRALWAGHAGEFRHLDVEFDAVHGAAHFWGDRFATIEAADHVHLLQWVLGELSALVEVAHMSFAPASMQQKYGGLLGDSSDPMIVAGNPARPLYAQGGLQAVLRWHAAQSLWSDVEVGTMLGELATEAVHDALEDGAELKDALEPALPTITEALALASDAADIQMNFAMMHIDAGHADVALEHLPRFDPAVRLQIANHLGNIEEPAFGSALEFVLAAELPGRMVRASHDRGVASLGDVSTQSALQLWQHALEHAPDRAARVLASVPRRWHEIATVAGELHAEDPARALKLYLLLLDCPAPPATPTARSYAASLNNGCVLANEREDTAAALALARAAMPYAKVSPYLPHAVACALAAGGDLDGAFTMVERAVDSDYPHLATDWPNNGGSILETDEHLRGLLHEPRFADLFARWRAVREPLRDGLAALDGGDPQAAIPLLEQAADADSPVRRQALIALGRAKIKLGAHGEAIGLCLEGLEDHRDAQIYANLITAAEQAGRVADVAQALVEFFPRVDDPVRSAQRAKKALEPIGDERRVAATGCFGTAPSRTTTRRARSWPFGTCPRDRAPSSRTPRSRPWSPSRFASWPGSTAGRRATCRSASKAWRSRCRTPGRAST